MRDEVDDGVGRWPSSLRRLKAGRVGDRDSHQPGFRDQAGKVIWGPDLNVVVRRWSGSTVMVAGSSSSSIRSLTWKQWPEITVTDQAVTEIDVVPKKLAGLTVITNELANDSDLAALQVVGDGLVRDLQTKIDAAFFANTTSNGPSGLGSLTGVQHVASGTIGDLDWAAEAISKAETVGVQLSSFVANPATVLGIQTLKVADTYNQPLLGVDASSPTKRSALGVPLFSSPAVAAGTIWGIPASRVFVVIRSDASLAVDPSAYFSSDRTGVRCTLRIGFGFPHQAAVIKVSSGGS